MGRAAGRTRELVHVKAIVAEERVNCVAIARGAEKDQNVKAGGEQAGD